MNSILFIASLLIIAAIGYVDHITGTRITLSLVYIIPIAIVSWYIGRWSGSPLTIAYLDLDNFKSVNDTLGHLAGDNLLKVIAQTIKKTLRVSDSVARIGGDEFVLLLTMDDYDQANTALRRIAGILIEHMTSNTRPVTFSIGAVTCRAPADSPEAIIKMADSLMYEVKQSGKNNIRHIAV